MCSSRRSARRLAASAVGFIGALLAFSAAASAQAVEQQEVVSQVGGSPGLGTGLAVDGDVMAAGAPLDSASGAQSGAVQLFVRDSATGEWTFAQELHASDPELYAKFGYSVALAGDVLVVGAPSKDENATTETGALYVFRRDATTGVWSEEQKLVPAAAANFDQVGVAVAVDGDRIVAGAPERSTDAGPYAGSAFLFHYQDATLKWVEETELVDPDSAMDDGAGFAVAIQGTTVLVASPLANENGTGGAGSVEVWALAGSVWSPTQELVASFLSDSHFGHSVALRGDQLLVGAPFEDASSTHYLNGAAYLFGFDGANWIEEQRFLPPRPASTLLFGFGVAVDGDLVAIGAPNEDPFGIADAGSAWLFRRRNSRRPWVADQELAATGAEASEYLGRDVVLADGQVFCAAMEANTSSGADSGAVEVYDADEISLRVTPSDPTPGAPIDVEVHRGDPGVPFLIVVEDLSGTPLFLPVIIDGFGADHARAYATTAPNPALVLHVGLRAWKVSPTGPAVASDWAYVDL